jgi:lipopolysaccharide export system protein LptA
MMSQRILIWLLAFSAFIPTSVVWGQKKILIKHADIGKYVSGKIAPEEKNTLIGNVQFEHDGAIMDCDSAWLFSATNTLKAFGNVVINQGDTLFTYGDFLDYNGNTKLAIMRKNVRLIDDSVQLFTDALNYNRNTEQAYYTSGGKIIDGETTLTSKEGVYFSQTKWYHFRGNVEVTNPEYLIESDTMHYHTERKVALFKGPTTITGDSSDIYCENGFYNTVTDIAQFDKNAVIRDRNTFLTGDSVYYEQFRGYGQAFENVVIYDTIEHYTIRGQYGEYLREPEYAFVTGYPTYSMKVEDDSLHIYGDTLYSRKVDSLGHKVINIWPRVKFFKDDLQGKCDSLVYQDSDSSIYMFKDPVVWDDSTQITGKHIIVTLKDGTLDSLKVYSDAFVISHEDYDFYHQIKGRDMFGKFVDDNIKRILVVGNGQSLYVIREDEDVENPPYVGVSRAECSEILIVFDDGEIDQITYMKQAESKTYPMEDVNSDLLKLDGFYARFNERPKTRWDIFPKDKPKL